MPDRPEILMEVGDLRGRISSIQTGLAEFRAEISEEKRSWHEVAIQSAQLRFQIEKLAESLDGLTNKVDDLGKSMAPLIEMRRAGATILFLLSAIGSVGIYLFGARLQDMINKLLWTR